MLNQLLGWKTNRKIIVFESDDWGSFRFKNAAIRDRYIKHPDPNLWMHLNDTFESYEDLSELDKVLTSVNDLKGNSACFTFLMNPANPDFKKIEAAHFEKYIYQDFVETLAERKDGNQILNWYQEAIKKNIIEVGFHGREHLNVQQWMRDLQQNDEIAKKGFNDSVWGLSKDYEPKVKSTYRSTFKMHSYEELDSLKVNIREGIEIINSTFDQKTRYFLAPDGPFHLSLNTTLAENGIKYIGLARLHQNPLEGRWHQKKVFWLGKQTKEKLKVITRNVVFEPSRPTFNTAEQALLQIEKAFKYNNPAVISTHRANYVGTLNPKNRTTSLAELKKLMNKILIKWPEAEFMTSSQLGKTLS